MSAALGQAAAAYKLAMSRHTDAFRLAQKELRNDADAGFINQRSPAATAARDNAVRAAEAVKSVREKFLNAVDANVSLRWRIINEFAPEPRS